MDAFSMRDAESIAFGSGSLDAFTLLVGCRFSDELFEQHRGTGCQRDVGYSLLATLVAKALLAHQGSGRRAFLAAKADNRLKATPRGVYGKLGRTCLEVSQAFLREATTRAAAALPENEDLSCIPPSLRHFRVLAFDGKKLKKSPKRLMPLRRYAGTMLGGKVLAGLLLNRGRIVATSATEDGEANDAPVTVGLLEQFDMRKGAFLFMADRQFCDSHIPNWIEQCQGHFVIRYSKKMQFFPENERIFRDRRHREVRDAGGIEDLPLLVTQPILS